MALIGELPSSDKPIPLVVAGIDGLPVKLQDVAMPLGIIDQDLDHKNLALQAILTDRTSLTIPVALGYKASWGNKVHHQGTIPPDINVSTFKLHLAHVHPIRAFLPREDKMEFATKVSLFIYSFSLIALSSVHLLMLPSTNFH